MEDEIIRIWNFDMAHSQSDDIANSNNNESNACVMKTILFWVPKHETRDKKNVCNFNKIIQYFTKIYIHTHASR